MQSVREPFSRIQFPEISLPPNPDRTRAHIASCSPTNTKEYQEEVRVKKSTSRERTPATSTIRDCTG